LGLGLNPVPTIVTGIPPVIGPLLGIKYSNVYYHTNDWSVEGELTTPSETETRAL